MDLIDIVEAIPSLKLRIDAIDLTTRSKRHSTNQKNLQTLLPRFRLFGVQLSITTRMGRLGCSSPGVVSSYLVR